MQNSLHAYDVLLTSDYKLLYSSGSEHKVIQLEPCVMYVDAFDVPREVVQEIVKWKRVEHPLCVLFQYYDYVNDNWELKSLALSYQSLLKSKGVERDERYCLIIKN